MVQESTSLGSALGANLSRQLEAVLEAMTDGVWVCDAEPRLLWVNRACEELNDIKRADVVGRTVAELLERRNFDHDVTSKVLAERRPVAINQKVRSGRTLLVNAAPVYDEDGAIVFVVAIERDLTELNLLRENLDRSRELSRKINSELLALRMKELELTELVAESDAMERALDTALRVAEFDTTVLLSGPSGSGKSLIAKVIHQSSARRESSFLSLNCGAIPPSLIEAELFGYAGGAFTGAARGGKPGLVEAADQGTLFLDEIDALPLDSQVKLLTFFDTQSFLRVGDARLRKVDVRVIAATNKDLPALVAEGKFREDLWFRLNVVPLHLPPLRERPQDVPRLVQGILARLNGKYGKERTITADALDLLCRYDFPGNVRELQNLLERVYVLSRGDTITPRDLPGELREVLPGLMSSSNGGGLTESLEALERELLKRACKTHRRQVDVARALGVSQPTIARLLKKHRLHLGES